MKPLIVGIDPGTTSAVAGITLDGEIEFNESGRGFSLDEIISLTMEKGRPVVATSDKAETPGLVKKYSSSLGLRLYEPSEDLSQDKKQSLGRGNNSHEIDAVAAAFNALNNLQKPVQKIERIAEEEGLTRVEASEKYFLDKQVKKDRGGETKTENAEKPEKPSETREARLERKIKRLESQVEELERKNDRLLREKQELKTRETLQGLQSTDKTEELRKREVLLRDKDEKIERFRTKIRNQQKIIAGYQKALKRLHQGWDLLPKASELDELRGSVAVSETDLEDVETVKPGRVEGIELDNFFVAEDYGKPFDKIIEEYRESRWNGKDS